MKNKLDIKKERLAIGYTQAKLAQELGVTEKSVSKWESGRGEPSFENLQKMCIIFNKNINDECCELRKKKRMFFALRVALAVVNFACFVISLIETVSVYYQSDNLIMIGEVCYFTFNKNTSNATLVLLILSILTLAFSISACFEFKNKEIYYVFYLFIVLYSIISIAFYGTYLLGKCILAIQVCLIVFLFYLYVVEKRRKVN